MNVCFICSEYPPGPHGGVGTVTQILARALVAAGHHVRVVGVYPHGYPAPDRETDHGVKVYRIRGKSGHGRWLVSRYRLYRQIAAWIKEGAVDVVEAPDTNGWFAGWPRLRVPRVVRAHGSFSYFAHEVGHSISKVVGTLEKSSLSRCDAWTSVSQYTAQVTQRVFRLERGADKVLYNPIEPSSRRVPIAARARKQVVFTGTLTKKKGIIQLIKAWSMVAASEKDAELEIYGKDGWAPDGGSMTEYLKRILNENAVDGVRFYGHTGRQDVLGALQRARVGVFPSYAEAFALAPLEAMACGCPTIYSTRGSGPELISDGTDGFLVDPDEPQALAEKILLVLREDPVAERVSQEGYRKVRQRFATEQLIPENLEFYERAIRDRSTG